jgi:hypothetical protein
MRTSIQEWRDRNGRLIEGTGILRAHCRRGGKRAICGQGLEGHIQGRERFDYTQEKQTGKSSRFLIIGWFRPVLRVPLSWFKVNSTVVFSFSN